MGKKGGWGRAGAQGCWLELNPGKTFFGMAPLFVPFPTPTKKEGGKMADY
jgi:hypothetical protein